MIVKNEEQYLERCLNGIKPILEHVDSELIITDTGSTDNTVEIAKKYANKVLYFNWINDFAAARNTALDIAQGEWFMFLDADEIFESCNGIIDFFNSGEYKQYSAAAYNVRNLLDKDNNYSDFMASRMTKIYPDTKFKGRIHEYLLHFTYPIKNITDVAIHYGYLFENQEQSAEKARRNTELLKTMLEEDPDYNPLIYLHLYDSCKMSGDIDIALNYLDEGIDYCKKINSPYIASYYYKKALHSLNNDDWTLSVNICKEYFSLDKKTRPCSLTTDIEIYGMLAGLLYEHLNFSEAMNAYVSFFDIYEDVKSGKLNTDDASALNFHFALDKNYIDQLCSFIDCCIICHEHSTALKYLTSLPIYEYNGPMESIGILTDKIIKVLELTGFSSSFECYRQLNDFGKSSLIGKLLNALYNKTEKAEIISQLRLIGNDIEWLNYKADIYESYFIADSLNNEMISDYIKKFGAYNDPDLLKLSMDKGIDISCFFLAEDFDPKHTAYMCCKSIDGFYESAENYNIGNISDNNVLPKAAKFYDYCISMRVIDNEDKPDEEKNRLIAKLFRLKTELNERYHHANSVKSEFDLLAASVKKNIRSFVYENNYEAAQKLLDDYRKINPDDTDIPGLQLLIK